MVFLLDLVPRFSVHPRRRLWANSQASDPFTTTSLGGRGQKPTRIVSRIGGGDISVLISVNSFVFLLTFHFVAAIPGRTSLGITGVHPVNSE